jgi:hypothetical protein
MNMEPVIVLRRGWGKKIMEGTNQTRFIYMECKAKPPSNYHILIEMFNKTRACLKKKQNRHKYYVFSLMCGI